MTSNHYKIQSPNNLGDLSLHISYMKYFANGVPLWPDNPIHVFSKLRYPAGVDLFDALLLLQHIDLVRALVWTGLLGSAATFYGFYRWGGPFGVAGFLFNGGLAGFEFFRRYEFADYQGERIAWKSIPLTMFVTQRGLLYAIPAGLLLLLHWRRKYYPAAVMKRRGKGAGSSRGGWNGRSTPRCRSFTSTLFSRSPGCSLFGCSLAPGRCANRLHFCSRPPSFPPPGWSG